MGDVVVNDGDWISMDGATGRVILGQAELVPAGIDENVNTVLGWADEVRRLRVRTNADTPEDARTAREFGAEGIGLCRTEHMFMQQERLPHVQNMIMADDHRGAREAPGQAAALPARGLRRHLPRPWKACR